jgi:hypothetical protein
MGAHPELQFGRYLQASRIVAPLRGKHVGQILTPWVSTSTRAQALAVQTVAHGSRGGRGAVWKESGDAHYL